MIAQRAGLDGETVAGLSGRIAERFSALEAYRECRRILFYLSFGNEVATDGLIASALAAGKAVYMPVVDGAKRSLDIVRIGDLDPASFRLNRFGIREPLLAAPEPLSEVELAVVPGLAFDALGGRLGFGAGYYDGLLKGFAGRGGTVALAYEFQVIDRVPQGPGDVPVSVIVTEKRTISCWRTPR